MAEFYSFIQGNRGAATRMGTKSSGIHAAAQSWHGSVAVELDYVNEEVWCRITSAPGSHSFPRGKVLYAGPLKLLVSPEHDAYVRVRGPALDKM